MKVRKKFGTLSHVSELFVGSFHVRMIVNKVTEFDAKLESRERKKGRIENVWIMFKMTQFNCG